MSHERMPLTDLHPHPQNPRQGDVDQIRLSLQKSGQYRPIIVNRGTHTGREWEILAGHHTVLALRGLHKDYPGTWPADTDVWVVDVDDDTATRILLADNRTADLGEYDDQQLIDLLTHMEDLEGSGYTPDDLNELLAGLVETEEPGGGAEEFPYPGLVTVTLKLMPPLAAQWDDYTQGFDTPEEALEHLLDHGA